MRLFITVSALLAVTITLKGGVAAENEKSPVQAATDVAPVWSGHPAGFALLTHGKTQFVAYYDTQRRMTVAQRELDSPTWKTVCLAEKFPPEDGKKSWAVTGWDAHNYVTLAVDEGGYLHLSGNMHNVPLVYLRSGKPLDAESFEVYNRMIGRQEEHVTYPNFLNDDKNRLIFTYRDGRSGDGVQLFNAYDAQSKTWQRLMDEPLFSGEGEVSAYYVGPVRDPSGMFHICWVWRETGDCSTNFNLCYARSKDLIHWENSNGQPLKLPITQKNAEVVDPVPVRGGMINGNQKISFDRRNRVMISYHKFDAKGNTQIYAARREKDGWNIHQTSDWNYRWYFQGGGAIECEIALGPIKQTPDGKLVQSYRHVKYGSGAWILDLETLKAAGPWKNDRNPRKDLNRIESTESNMFAQFAGDSGKGDDPRVYYLLRWESRPANRDRPYPGPPPKPSMLRVYKIEK